MIFLIESQNPTKAKGNTATVEQRTNKMSNCFQFIYVPFPAIQSTQTKFNYELSKTVTSKTHQ
jgi:hypothetical protein